MMLKAARRFACSMRGDMRGRSSYARLHLANYDPGAQLATDPILEWARAVWDGFANKRDIETAWRALTSMVQHTRLEEFEDQPEQLLRRHFGYAGSSLRHTYSLTGMGANWTCGKRARW